MFASKFIFLNLLNLGVIIEPVVSGALFPAFSAFVSKAALAAKVVIPGILLSTFVNFYLE